jgi:prepilin-type N-terminal cleavage/methylation domain-containing protein
MSHETMTEIEAQHRGRLQAQRSVPQHGFSMLEMLVVLTISMVLAGFAIGNFSTAQKNSRISGASRDLAAIVSEAKLSGAADFTHARVYADLSANAYHLEIWNKNGNSGVGCWQTVGDLLNSCTASSSPVQSLPSGVTFGYGSLPSAPSNTQTTLGQAPLCYTGYGGEGGNTTTLPNTACVEFNSRGVPSNPSNSGKADATQALYITDSTSVDSVTVLATGFVQRWYSLNKSTASWQQR